MVGKFIEYIYEKKEKAATTYPRSASDVFWLHMRRKRGLFLFSFSFFFFLLFCAFANLSKGLVRVSYFFLFSSFELNTSVTAVAIVYHIYTNDNLGHHAFVCWDMPDLHEIARWLDDRNDVGRKRFDNAYTKKKRENNSKRLHWCKYFSQDEL